MLISRSSNLIRRTLSDLAMLKIPMDICETNLIGYLKTECRRATERVEQLSQLLSFAIMARRIGMDVLQDVLALTIPDDLLDSLMKDYKSPEDLLGETGLFAFFLVVKDQFSGARVQ